MHGGMFDKKYLAPAHILVNIPQVIAAVQRPPPRQYYANAKDESMRVKTKHFEARTAEAISQLCRYLQHLHYTIKVNDSCTYNCCIDYFPRK